MRRDSRRFDYIKFSVVSLGLALIGTACDNWGHGNINWKPVPVLVLVSVEPAENCRLAWESGDVSICKSFLSGEVEAWGDKGWVADAVSGNGISVWHAGKQKFKDSSIQEWRQCILATLNEKALNSDFEGLVPPTLGESFIWVGEAEDTLGLYYVNTEGTGVVTLVSRGGIAGIQCVILGAAEIDHEPLFRTALSGVFFEKRHVGSHIGT